MYIPKCSEAYGEDPHIINEKKVMNFTVVTHATLGTAERAINPVDQKVTHLVRYLYRLEGEGEVFVKAGICLPSIQSTIIYPWRFA